MRAWRLIGEVIQWCGANEPSGLFSTPDDCNPKDVNNTSANKHGSKHFSCRSVRNKSRNNGTGHQTKQQVDGVCEKAVSLEKQPSDRKQDGQCCDNKHKDENSFFRSHVDFEKVA